MFNNMQTLFLKVKYTGTEKERDIGFHFGSSNIPLPWLKITVQLSVRKMGGQ